jgi:excisionase family DNA binding protein
MKRNGTIEKTTAQIKLGQPGPRLLTIEKAAEFLGLTDWAMRSRIWSGDIPVVRFPGGRKMYIDVRDIERFIERNKMTYD